MKTAKTLEGVAYTHVYSLQNKIVPNYIRNVVCLMSLELNNYNKDSRLRVNKT